MFHKVRSRLLSLVAATNHLGGERTGDQTHTGSASDTTQPLDVPPTEHLHPLGDGLAGAMHGVTHRSGFLQDETGELRQPHHDVFQVACRVLSEPQHGTQQRAARLATQTSLTRQPVVRRDSGSGFTVRHRLTALVYAVKVIQVRLAYNVHRDVVAETDRCPPRPPLAGCF